MLTLAECLDFRPKKAFNRKIRKDRRENLNCVLCVLGESSALSAVKGFTLS
jgi:hypothetical protein